MTDPLTIAAEIEKWAGLKQTGDFTTMQMRPERWHLIAAALRLAEVAMDCDCQCARAEADAYRKARGA